MLNEKDLPLEFKISGLNSDQISLENRQMIQKLFKNHYKIETNESSKMKLAT